MIRRLAALASLFLPAWGVAATVPGDWTPTWSAEFNTGASDLNGFSYDLGGGGWGNNERQVYTNNASNVSVSGGSLNVTAVAAANGTYTSSRVKTAGLFSQTYGLFEFRAKMPVGQGLWPAIWMMPAGSTYGDWPRSGEVDIMETVGQNTQHVQGSLHSGPAWDQNNTQTQTLAGSGLMPSGFSTADWHTYGLQWTKGTATTPGSFKWFVDGVVYQTRQGGWTLPSGASSPDAPFDKPFYLIFNVAVGGDYVGTPNLSPGAYGMQIDYARAYTATVPEPAMAAVAMPLICLIGRRRRS